MKHISARVRSYRLPLWRRAIPHMRTGTAALVLAAAACGPAHSPTPDGSGDDRVPGASDSTLPPRSAEPITCDGLYDRILVAAPTREAFRARFGEPDSVSRSTEPNRHVRDAVDSLFTVFYPGFRMDIRTPTGARDLATEAVITDNRYIAFPDIGIGATADRVEAILGKPTHRDSDALTYDCGLGAGQPVTFHLVDATVRSVEISYYVD